MWPMNSSTTTITTHQAQAAARAVAPAAAVAPARQRADQQQDQDDQQDQREGHEASPSRLNYETACMVRACGLSWPAAQARPTVRAGRDYGVCQSFASRSIAGAQRLVLLGEAKAHHALVEPVCVEGRQRDRGHADLARQPQAELGLVEVADSAKCRRTGNNCPALGSSLKRVFGQPGREQVALALIEGRQTRGRAQGPAI